SRYFSSPPLETDPLLTFHFPWTSESLIIARCRPPSSPKFREIPVNADQYFKAGQLQEALDAQLKAVKADPADHGKRIFLFELLVFAGDLERARKQIGLVDYGELEVDAAVLAYNKLLDAEAARRNLFAFGTAPRFFGEVPEHIHWRLDALACLREGR